MQDKTPARLNILIPIIVAVVGLIGTITVAVIQSMPETARLSVEQTAAAAASTQLAASPSAEIDQPSPTPDPALPSAPLAEIFPQVGGGERFIFTNNNGVLDGQVVASGACLHSGSYGLQLTWEMKSSGVGSWGISWAPDPQEHFDASAYQALSFWVRGTAGGETFRLGLRDMAGGEASLESGTLLLVTTEWQQVSVPLDSFPGVNPGVLENLNFSFTKAHGAGTLCIDDLSFTP